MRDLRARTIRATGWVLGSQIWSQIISFGFGIALARLLGPDDFGLIAMVLVFTGFAGLLSDIGLGSALVQKTDIRDDHYDAVFWLNASLGGALAVAFFLSAPLISAFYGRPEIDGICKALALTFPIGALALVPNTRLVKELSFKYVALSDLVALILSGMVAVTMAAMGMGYWSLVAQIISRRLITTLIVWAVSDWRPGYPETLRPVRELIGFSSSVFGTRALRYASNNIDRLLLGRYLDGQALGIYDKAHSMMLFPLQNVSHVIGRVMFPSLSLIQSDTERVKAIYLRSTQAIALLTFPMMAGMFVVADSFVLGVLGPSWADLIPILRIFCVTGIMTSIVTVTGALYLSQGAAALDLRVNLVTQPLRMACIALGLFWGVPGVATGYLAASFIGSLITLTVAGRLIDLRLSTLVRSLSPTLFPTSVMAGLVWAVRPLSGIHNELILFLVQTASGILIYLPLVALMKLPAYLDVAQIFCKELTHWRRREPASDSN